ncbi:MAG: hypothetical protein WA996_21330 [Candidatus Promineifilaceae bacterium]
MSHIKPMNREDPESRITTKEIGIIVAHGLVGWAICGAIMAIGTQLTSLETR